MKKAIAFLVLCSSLLVILTACGKHTHEYEDKWSFNEYYHWHDTTCGHGSGEKSEHSMVALSGGKSVCSVCGYEQSANGNGSAQSTEGASAGVSTEGVLATSGAVNVQIECVSGTENAYTIENNVITFSGLSADSVYKISGELDGSIIIDAGDDYKFDLELSGFTLSSSTTNPITVLSGNEVSITAKKDTENTIYDARAVIDESDEALYSGAIHSLCDLEICGKGALTLVSDNNNGIHSKDDLEIKNLPLCVISQDNCLKGNDSVSLENATVTVIAKAGDGIKTTSSDISSKGNQRGDIDIIDSIVNIYCACDGIDASHNVSIDGESTEINIYTDKYSSYSGNVTEGEDGEKAEDLHFIRFTSNLYSYSVKYYNSDSDYLWVNADYYKSVSGGRTTYYYYSFPIYDNYSQLQFFIYDSGMEQGQESEYLAASDYMSWNDAYDTFALVSRGGSLGYSWTNYSSTVADGFGGPGGMGGMQEGNSDKGDYSTKGIKANNEITISNGKIYIKAYDDAIHVNTDETLENGNTPLGNLNILGGSIIIYSNDDGLHADGSLKISGGDVSIINSYEGIEGYTIDISGGRLTINSSDDGMNSTATSGTAITISDGEIYIYAKGDGIDSNTRTSYEGIVFKGGNTIVICNSNGNSSLDTEQGYKYEGGYVLAVGSSGGMSSEAEHCYDFSSYATTKSISLSQGSYLLVNDGATVTLKMNISMNARVVFLGDSSASITSSSSSSYELDSNGVNWN